MLERVVNCFLEVPEGGLVFRQLHVIPYQPGLKEFLKTSFYALVMIKFTY